MKDDTSAHHREATRIEIITESEFRDYCPKRGKAKKQFNLS